MSNETPNPFGITREEILELAANKIADSYCESESLQESVNKKIATRIETVFAGNLNGRIDTFLSVEMDKLLRTEICPVDIWGQSVGKPTTIRDSLTARARIYWDEKVNEKGEATTGWSSKARHEWLFQKIVGEEFQSVVKQNLVNLIGAFKDALREDAHKKADEYLNELLKVKSHGDQKKP